MIKNRSVSYENDNNKKEYTSDRHSLKDYYKKNSLEKNNENNDKNDFNIKNSKNIIVREDQKIFKNLMPISMNKIEYSFDLDKKTSNTENIYEIRNPNTENLNKNQTEKYNNIKNHTIVETKLKKIKKPNWNETNKTIKSNNISFEYDNKEPKIQRKNKGKIELNIENFEINITDNNKKYNEELYIEKNSIQFDKNEKEKSNNSNLVLLSGQKNKIKTNYPKKVCDNSTKTKSESPPSTEGKNKNLFLKKNVEQILVKSKKSKKDWNILNNNKKELNISIYEKKQRDNLLKEKKQTNEKKEKEEEKKWDMKKGKENEKNLTSKDFQNNLENNENEEEILFNDDYNIIRQNYMMPVKTNIKQAKQRSDESNSEYDILNNIKIKKNQFSDFNRNLNNRISSYQEVYENININNVCLKIPYENEIEKENDRKENNDYNEFNLNQIKNKINYENNNNTPQNLYLKKKINSHSTIPKEYKKSQNNEKRENFPSTQYIYREIITNIQSEITNENEKENQKNINKLEIDKHNNENNNSEMISPKSRTNYCYREQIIALSPNHSENKEDLLTKAFSYQNFIKNSDINKRNYNIENINNNLKEIMGTVPKDNNNFGNQKENYRPEKSEEIPKIQDEESELPINSNFIQEKRNYKTQKMLKNELKNNNYYQIKGVPNHFITKEKLQNNIKIQKKGKIKEEKMNRKEGDKFFHKLAIINKDHLNNINDFISLCKTNNQFQKIELSKSQEN